MNFMYVTRVDLTVKANCAANISRIFLGSSLPHRFDSAVTVVGRAGRHLGEHPGNDEDKKQNVTGMSLKFLCSVTFITQHIKLCSFVQHVSFICALQTLLNHLHSELAKYSKIMVKNAGQYVKY